LHKILIVTREYPTIAEGGIARRLSKTVPRLLDLGLEVGVVTFSSSSIAGETVYPIATTSKILYTHMGEPSSGDFASIINDIWRLDRYADEISRKKGYELVQIEEPIFGPFIESPLPRIVTVHNTQSCVAMAYLKTLAGPRQLKRLLFSGIVGYGFDYACLHGCDRVIAVSPSVKDEIVRYYHMSSSAIEIVPNGLDPPPMNAKSSEMTKGQSDMLTIACVGRLVDVKRVDVLLKALAHLKAVSSAKFRCYVIGTGPSASALKSLSNKLALEDEVTFTGFITDEALGDILASADIVVSPSDYETFGFSVYEGALYNCAPVVSRIPAFTSILVDGSNSLMFEPGDEAQLAAKLEQLGSDRALLGRIQRNARLLAEGMGWDGSVRKLVRVYSRLLDGHTAS